VNIRSLCACQVLALYICRQYKGSQAGRDKTQCVRSTELVYTQYLNNPLLHNTKFISIVTWKTEQSSTLNIANTNRVLLRAACGYHFEGRYRARSSWTFSAVPASTRNVPKSTSKKIINGSCNARNHTFTTAVCDAVTIVEHAAQFKAKQIFSKRRICRGSEKFIPPEGDVLKKSQESEDEMKASRSPFTQQQWYNVRKVIFLLNTPDNTSRHSYSLRSRNVTATVTWLRELSLKAPLLAKTWTATFH